MSNNYEQETVLAFQGLVSLVIAQFQIFLRGHGGWNPYWGFGYRIETDKPVAEIKQTGHGLVTVRLIKWGENEWIKFPIKYDRHWLLGDGGEIQFGHLEKMVGWKFSLSSDLLMRASDVLPGCSREYTWALLKGAYGLFAVQATRDAQKAEEYRQLMTDVLDALKRQQQLAEAK